MGHSRAELLRVEERRSRVAELHAKGLRQAEIAEQLGLGTGVAAQVMVSRDLKAVARQWRASSVRNFDDAKGALLAELAEVKRAAWQGWERSQRESEAVGVTKRKVRAGPRLYGDEGDEDGGRLVDAGATTTVNRGRRDGDPR
jgi:hypothetical protein